MSEEAPESVSPAARVSHRQLKLLHLENPLTLRFGNEFFRSLPSGPGVYFFHGADDQLLYIGQSNDLRARVSSYRHVTPEQNPRRTLRLVSRVTRIRWEVCSTAAEAIERERVLLLEHRPPFNRAGVWKGDPWWLRAEVEDGRLHLELSREGSENNIGPLPSGFRHVFGPLVRCIYRLARPECSLAEYPHGLISHHSVPLTLRLSLPESEAWLQQVRTFLTADADELPGRLQALPPPKFTAELEYWQEQAECLERFALKTKHLKTDAAA